MLADLGECAMTSDVELQVGDRIRFSVPVLEDWEHAAAADLVFRLQAVQVQHDGVKVLVLTRDEPQVR